MKKIISKKSNRLKQLIYIVFFIFIVMNAVAFFHAYRFTHFTSTATEKTKKPSQLSAAEKVKILLFGIKNPKPLNKQVPQHPYQSFTLNSHKRISCWYIKASDSMLNKHSKGTVIVFHGYSGNKSSMLDKANVFLKLGYNTLLVDFMGSGDSEGLQTSVGYLEAQEVKTTFDCIEQSGEKNIFLFGTSMGAVAIMKAMHDYQLNCKGILIECPFGSLYQTTCARFTNMKVPHFPMAALLVFWGGIQNNYWAFSHTPIHYAKKIKCPTLLMYGEKDQEVSRHEIDEIFSNLNNRKSLCMFPKAGHENYLHKYNNEWKQAVQQFLIAETSSN